jgi:GntR family transcriptional regulator
MGGAALRIEDNPVMTMERVNKDLPTPAYSQLKEIIREKIESGEWKEGGQIPSESELSTFHRLSKMTVRQAITELCQEKLLYRERGKGTFVAILPNGRFERDMANLTILTEDLISKGFAVTARVLELTVDRAPRKIAAELHIPPDEPVTKIVRLKFIDQAPSYLDTTFLNRAFDPKADEETLVHHSLLGLLQKKHGPIFTYADTVIDAISSDLYQSRYLKVKRGAPLLRIKTIVCQKTGQPILTSEMAARPDKFKYFIRRKR